MQPQSKQHGFVNTHTATTVDIVYMYTFVTDTQVFENTQLSKSILKRLN